MEGGQTLLAMLNLNAYSDVPTTKWMSNYGTEYQTGMFVCISKNIEMPVFGKINSIIINDDQAFILTGTVDSLYFDEHLDAYCIQERNDSFSVISVDMLIYYRPYNKQFSNGMDEKVYILPQMYTNGRLYNNFIIIIIDNNLSHYKIAVLFVYFFLKNDKDGLPLGPA